MGRTRALHVHPDVKKSDRRKFLLLRRCDSIQQQQQQQQSNKDLWIVLPSSRLIETLSLSVLVVAYKYIYICDSARSRVMTVYGAWLDMRFTAGSARRLNCSPRRRRCRLERKSETKPAQRVAANLTTSECRCRLISPRARFVCVSFFLSLPS